MGTFGLLFLGVGSEEFHSILECVFLSQSSTRSFTIVCFGRFSAFGLEIC